MPRALWAFRQTDLEVIAAPTGFIATDMPSSLALTLIPRAGVLVGSRLAVHEGLGRVWYLMRY